MTLHHPDPGEWVVVAPDDNAHPAEWLIACVEWAADGDVLVHVDGPPAARELVRAADLRASSWRREDAEHFKAMAVDVVRDAERRRDEARQALQAGLEAAHRAVARAITDCNTIPARRRHAYALAEAARAPSEFDAPSRAPRDLLPEPALRVVEPDSDLTVARLCPAPTTGGDAA